jgi:ubiquinone/menaquinone biosynthesis C-methylase UbiE
MHKFSPGNAERLEQPDRHNLIPPVDTLQRLGLRAGMRFLDVGAGTGFFSRPAAMIVGATGKVYSVDMSREMLEVLRASAIAPVMEVLLSQEYRIPLADQTADMALLAFVLHENVDRRRLVDEVMRTLTPDGRLVVIEWKKQEEEQGPAMEERLGEEELMAEMRRYAMTKEGTLNHSHYYKVFQREKNASS